VTRSFLSSCSSASVHSLPCGPRMAEEKESGFPAPLRFKSAGAGRGVHRCLLSSPQRKRQKTKGVVVKAKGGLGVVYTVEKVIREGGVCGGVVVQVEVLGGKMYRVGKVLQVGVGKGRGEPGFVPTPRPQ
jgi:hypothetical protein